MIQLLFWGENATTELGLLAGWVPLGSSRSCRRDLDPRRGSRDTAMPAPPPATMGLQFSALVASLSLWGASDSAMGSMWQEVGTVTHGWLAPSPLEGGIVAEAPEGA